VTRIVAGVGDLAQRTGDSQAQIRYLGGLKTNVDGFSRFGHKTGGYGFSDLALKTGSYGLVNLDLKTKRVTVCRLCHKTDERMKMARDTRRDLAACFIWK
jgi:hypothetical protein